MGIWHILVFAILHGKPRRWYYRRVYLRSAHWRKKRAGALRRASYRCQSSGCGYRPSLDVHHLTYARIGWEWPGDLRVLCRRHHNEVHNVP